MKKPKPIFDKFIYKAIFVKGEIAMMATYKLIKIEGREEIANG